MGPWNVRGAMLLAALLASSAAAQVRFEVLTDFPDTNYQGAFAISGDGSSVVGFARRDGSSGPDAVRWNADGTFDHYGPGNAWSTSFDGRTVAADAPNSMYRYRDGEAVRLETPDGRPKAGQPRAMSADGETIAGWFYSQGWDEAFVWTESTGLVGLGLDSGFRNTRAFGISPDGATVVGEADIGSGALFGFRWTESAGYELLRSDNNGPALTIAFDVSADGGFIVGSTDIGRAGYWTEATGAVSLPPLQRFSKGVAYGVTPDGSTVVGTDIDGSDEIAFLWTPDDGIRPLADVLLQDYGLDVGSFVLDRATGISDDGLSICGIGHYAGTSLDRAWHVTVPAPATTALLGAPVLVRRRRR